MKDVYSLIQKYETAGDFTHAVVTDEMLKQSETVLGVLIPEEYKYFLKEYGHGGIEGLEVLGIGKTGTKIFERETLKFRTYGMPDNLIIVENCDEWVYCIDTKNEKIVKWMMGMANYVEVFACFDEFLSSRINDMIENM